ncbi:hypothetical protein [Bifidobacterium ramosum]|uniref:Uncharacterized protein n=1 Tax=Bifidobacterium ramosum TaxID=1798158 RepID=A0A7K3TAW7_9BIFI|nr:hypothetical protein [Bifidobacterium ramosum]NEG71324.1 hypothetical protein [Bifidobacterium ramosum]
MSTTILRRARRRMRQVSVMRRRHWSDCGSVNGNVTTNGQEPRADANDVRERPERKVDDD